MIDRRRPPLRRLCGIPDCGLPLTCTWYVDGRADLACDRHGLVGMVSRGRGLTGITIEDEQPARRP
jgi:hypothetical protein